MTISISKEFIAYIILFTVITVFGLLYMTQSHYIYEQSSAMTEQIGEQNQSNINNDRTYNDPVQNGEVLGVVN